MHATKSCSCSCYWRGLGQPPHGQSCSLTDREASTCTPRAVSYSHLLANRTVNNAIVSAHRRILGLASVVCVLVKIRVSSISLYKLDTDKLTAPFESAHQFTLVCTVSDSKTVPGCHYNLCSNHSFVLTNSYLDLSLFRAVFSLPGLFLPLLYTDLCLLQPWSEMVFFVLRALRKCSCHDRDSPALLDPPPMIEFLELHACSVRIKGRHALKWGMCSIATQNSSTVYSGKTENKRWFQASGTW